MITKQDMTLGTARPKYKITNINRSNGQWHSHVENIVNLASKILALMRKLKFSISRNALNQMYMSYLLPVVEYASVVWDGCSERDSQTLQKIQN